MFLRLHTEILFLSIRYNSCVLLTVDFEDVLLACCAVATYLPSSTILRAHVPFLLSVGMQERALSSQTSLKQAGSSGDYPFSVQRINHTQGIFIA